MKSSFFVVASFCLLVTTSVSGQSDSPASKPEKDVFAEVSPLALPAKDLIAIVDKIEELDDESVQRVLNRSEVEFFPDGRISKTTYSITKVLARDGIDPAANIEIEWTPWFEKKPVVKSRIISRRGIETHLDPALLTESMVGEVGYRIFSDAKILQGVRPAIAVGSVIETLVTIEQSQPFSISGSRYADAISPFSRSRFWELKVSYPESLAIKSLIRGDIEIERSKVIKDGKVVETLKKEFKDRPEFHWRSNMGPQHVMVPTVDFTNGQSWKSIASEYAKYIDREIAASKPEVIENICKNIKTEGVSRRELIEAALAETLARVRYTGHAFGIRAIVPKPPHETIASGLGDCKDQSTLLVAVLRKLGIKSNVALLDSGYGTDVSPEIPALNSFNHAIVVVPGEPAIWIDPTAEFYGVGELPAADTNRLALIADENTEQLVLIPRVSMAVNRSSFAYEFDLQSHGVSQTTITIEKTGSSAGLSRESFDFASKKKARESWLENKKYDGLIELLDFKVSDAFDASSPFKLSAKYLGDNAIESGEGSISVYVDGGRILNELPAELHSGSSYFIFSSQEDGDKEKREREEPFVFDEFLQNRLQYTIKPPPGYVLESLPDSRKVAVGDFEFLSQFEKQGRNVVVTYSLKTGEEDLPADQVKLIREDLEKSLVGQDRSLRIKLDFRDEVLSLIEDGKFVDAIKKISAIKSDFREPWQYELKRAEYLLKLGMGKYARKIAADVVEQQPESAIACATYANILSHDLLGREFRFGYDRSGALAQLERAIELSPNSKRYQWQHASVLNRNEFGVPHQKRDNLESAKKEFVSLLTEAEGFQGTYIMLMEALEACLVANDTQSMRNIFQTYEVNEITYRYYLAETLLNRGANGLQQELTESGMEAFEKAEQLGDVTQLMYLIDRFDLAKVSLELGKSLTSLSPTKQLKAVGTRDQQNEYKLDDPRRAMDKIIEWAFRDGRDFDAVREHFRKGTTDQEITDFVFEMLKVQNSEYLVDTAITPQYRFEAFNTQYVGYKSSNFKASIDRNFLVSRPNQFGIENSTALKRDFFEVAEGTARMVPSGANEQNWGDIALEYLTNDLETDDELALQMLQEAFRLQKQRATSERPPFLIVFESDSQGLNEQLKKVSAACLSKYENEKATEFLLDNVESLSKPHQIAVYKDLSYRLRSKYDPRAIEMSRKATELSNTDQLTWTYFMLDMTDEALQSLEKYRKQTSSKLTNYRLARIALKRGEIKEGREHIRRYASTLFRTVDTIPSEMANNYAWAALFKPNPPQEALRSLQLAYYSSQYHYTAHTIATYKALDGNCVEVIYYLGQSLERHPTMEYDLDDDLVIGRLAEELGVDDAADFYYDSCLSMPLPGVLDCEDLAKIWKKKMVDEREEGR